MAIIKKSTNNKCRRGCEGKGNPPALLGGIGAATMENSMEVPSKTKTKLPYDPAIPLLGIYPGKLKKLIQKDTRAPMFMEPLFTIGKTWKQPKCPWTDEWIKMWYINTVEYYPAIKKNEIMPSAATWTDLEIIILSEVRER